MRNNRKFYSFLISGMISFMIFSLSFSPVLNTEIMAQGENQTSQNVTQDKPNIGSITQKFREIVTNVGINLTLPQDGNLSEILQQIASSDQFNELSQQIPQELSQLGINISNVQNLQQEEGSTLVGLVQKLQNITNNRIGGQ